MITAYVAVFGLDLDGDFALQEAEANVAASPTNARRFVKHIASVVFAQPLEEVFLQVALSGPLALAAALGTEGEVRERVADVPG